MSLGLTFFDTAVGSVSSLAVDRWAAFVFAGAPDRFGGLHFPDRNGSKKRSGVVNAFYPQPLFQYRQVGVAGEQ